MGNGLPMNNFVDPDQAVTEARVRIEITAKKGAQKFNETRRSASYSNRVTLWLLKIPS